MKADLEFDGTHCILFEILSSIAAVDVYIYLVTHADGSRVSIALICLCLWFCLSVIQFVCPHDKTKTAETKIAILSTEIVHCNTLPTNEY